MMDAKTRRMSFRIPAMVRTTAEVLPIWEGRSQVSATVQARIDDCWVRQRTYQKHHGNVQEEGDQSVRDEGHNTQRIDIVHSHARDFSEEHDDAVGNRTSRSKVVNGNQGVHLEFGGAEETLDHDQAQGLEDDTPDLDWVCLLGAQRGKMSTVTKDILRNPNISNLISPNEAMATPTTIKNTLPSVRRLAWEIPKAQVASKVTTALVALSIWIKDTLRYRYARLPQIRLKLNIRPIGTMARLYFRRHPKSACTFY